MKKNYKTTNLENMKLQRVIISNFKSIKELSFEFEENYHVLAGKNECGKTNILEAISYLDDKKKLDKSSIREPLPDEEPITNSSIQFIFYPKTDSKSEIKKIYESLFLNYETIRNNTLVNYFDSKISVEQFFHKRLGCVITVDFIKNTRLVQYYTISDYYEVTENWKRITDPTPPSTTLVDKKTGKSVEIGKAKIINISNFKEIPESLVVELSPEFINEQIGTKLTELLKTKKTKCIHWFYDSKNLLPSKVVLAEFKENPNTCLPLKYLFNLAGINDIKAAIDLASSRGTKALRNSLSRISKHATMFFNEKWEEYNNIEFDLTLNGPHLEIGIREKNCYDFSQRSDGFKRFITFLIMISVQVETSQLENSVLLIDEPEISLHPSGQRFLRAELRKISETNKVIFSTHSIFLIDTDNLENHYIVEKTNEETAVKKIESSNIVDEEVVYNALGYSVFETLKEKNILFEGWRDKYLFKIAINRIPNTYKEIKPLKDYGLTHAKGVKEIKYISPILELANRECIIISDSDKPAKEKQKDYQSEPKPYKWLCYDELINGEIAVTAEDFIKSDYITKTLKKYKERYGIDTITSDKLEHPKGKIHAITEWIKPSSKGNLKTDLNEIKEELFSNLKSTNIETKYYDLLKKIYELTN